MGAPPEVDWKKVAQDDLEVLDQAGCFYWACQGPDVPSEDMVTCFCCRRVRELRTLLKEI